MPPLRTMACIALLSFEATAAAAANDGLDPRFGTAGVLLIGTTPGGHALWRLHGLAVQPDGKLLLATATDGVTVEMDPQPTRVPAIVRLNADGSWDETFGDSGIYRFPGTATVSTYGGEVRGIAVLSDGSIIAAGETYKRAYVDNDVHSCTLLFKLSANGTLEPTFGNDGSLCFDFAPEVPDTTYFEHNSSIAIGTGDLLYLTTPQTNLSYGALARFSPNGTLDASYGVGGFATGAEGTTFAMLALQADERIIATDGPYTYRFAESGEPDPTFGAGGELQIDFAPFPTAYAQSAMLDDDGRLLSAVSDGENFQMSRIESDGTLDATFNGAQQQQGFPGFAAVPFDTNAPYVLAAAAAHDRIFAVGILDVTAQAGSTMLLARFNSDASFDTTYGDTAHPGWTGLLIDTGGTSYNDPYALANDRAGRVLVGGYFLGDTIGRCSGIVRIIPDDLFNDGFDPPLPRVCPP